MSRLAHLILGLLLCATPALAQATDYKAMSFSDVKAAADAGNADAQYDLGCRYYYVAASKNDKKAREAFTKAAAQGQHDAEYELATMVENGEGGAQDSAQAFALYLKAATGGVSRADADVGLMYLTGDGTPKDIAQAVKWLQAGADAGEPRAEALMGSLYRDGTGVEADAPKAITLLKASVKQRFAPAATFLEEMYRDGDGVAKDPIVSHAWRTIAAYLNDRGSIEVPKGATQQYYILMTPNLSQADNMKAWELYKSLMLEFGFATDDGPSPDGKTADDAAGQFMQAAGKKAGQN